MRRATIAFAAVAVVFAAQPIMAQEFEPGPIRGGAGGGFIVAFPVGDFRNHIDEGVGFGFDGHFNITRRGALRLRADAGFILYGHESREDICFSNTVGCRVRLDLTTSNSIAYGSIGPEVMLPYGLLRPYLNAGVGFSYFSTDSNISGVNSGESVGHTTNLDDAVLALTGGGGLYVPFQIKHTPVSIDVSARYHRNGTVEFLREGDIIDNPDGTIAFTPRRSEADLVTFQFGVSVGIRGKSPH
jgi:opacity protein-like surface antigen